MQKQFQVSIIKCHSYNPKEVKKALEESLKNIDFKFRKGMKILIKPNLLAPHNPEEAITTNPIIIEELCKILKKHNSKIYIGESSGAETEKAFEVCGINKLSKYAEIINFETLPKKLFRLEKNIMISLPEIIFEVDLIINLPKMKTHGLTQVTLCVKNLYGCIPGKLKEDLHKLSPYPKNFSRLLVELHKIIKPQLNIIDGIAGIEGEGPGASGKKINPKVMIMGENANAVDIIASEFMGFNSENIYTNKFSGINKKDIEINGNGRELKLKFEKPKMYITRFFRPIIIFFPNPKIKFNLEKCRQCHICEEKCPVKAIKINLKKCDNKKCIKCLCCIELCPNSAVYLEEHWTKKILKSAIKRFRKN